MSRRASILSLLLSVACCLVCAASVPAQEMVTILGPHPDGTPSDYSDAYGEADAIKNDASSLGFSSSGTPGQKDFDERTVSFLFQTEDTGVQLAAFSDDGVSVTITDLDTGAVTTPLTNYSIGQALPDLGQSLKLVPQSFIPGHSYRVETHYLNTLYTGDGDIDGLKFFAFGGNALALADPKLMVDKAALDPDSVFAPLVEPRNALVRKGQVVHINLWVFDEDTMWKEPLPAGEQKQLLPKLKHGLDVKVKITLTNATLSGKDIAAGTRDTTITMNPFSDKQLADSSKLDVTVDPNWNEMDDVLIEVVAIDNSVFVKTGDAEMDELKLASDPKAIADGTSGAYVYKWKSSAGKPLPTTQTLTKQLYLSSTGLKPNQPVNGVYPPQLTPYIQNTYHYGIDLPTPNPDYQGIIISEKWGEKYIPADIQQAWITDKIVADATADGAGQDVAAILDWWAVNEGHMPTLTSSWAIDDKDDTTDDYAATWAKRLIEKEFLVKSRILANSIFSVYNKQRYYRPDLEQIGVEYLLGSSARVDAAGNVGHKLIVTPTGAQ